MASGLLVLLDDIATVLDDVAAMSKVAAKKTAGILGDDLALNAQQVTGVQSNRELPVVWAVAKGSLVNKAILVPSALLLSFVAPWSIPILMILGGTFLCFEGCEKIAHKWFHPDDVQQHQEKHEARIADPAVNLVEMEKTKIRGAIRTDFILSAEIIVITLGAVSEASMATKIGTLVVIAMLMTVGVYGLVAAIVRLDDVGAALLSTSEEKTLATLRHWLGDKIIAAMPYLMRGLSIAGTAAMFLVGGGILVHGIPPIHHAVENVQHQVAEVSTVGGLLSTLVGMGSSAILGILAGIITLLVVSGCQRFFKGSAKN